MLRHELQAELGLEWNPVGAHTGTAEIEASTSPVPVVAQWLAELAAAGILGAYASSMSSRPKMGRHDIDIQQGRGLHAGSRRRV